MAKKQWISLSAVLLILCILFSLLPAVYATEKESGLSKEELEVLKYTNIERAKEGLAPLTALPELQRGTDVRAEELVTVTDHIRPDGSRWYTIFDTLQLPPYYWAGENVAAGQRSPQAVVNAWMNSQGHRENILRTAYAHMGVGYQYVQESIYKTYWVQVFFTSQECVYTSMNVGFYEEGTAPVGTALEDLNLVACVQCKTCGRSYLPVLPEYCTGYDPTEAGKQQVTVSVLGQSATVTVDLMAEEEETEPTEPSEEPTEPQTFSDVEKGSWYEGSVLYMVDRGLMNGVGKGRFNPMGQVTRAMLVTILYRVEGSPSVEGMTNPFTDVPQTWYTDAVIWAANQGIVTGVKPDRFNPNGNITREQIATILYRYAGSPEAPDTLPPFADNLKISAYALRPMNWAISQGLINGVGGGFLAPGNTATRAQIATILARYLQK